MTAPLSAIDMFRLESIPGAELKARVVAANEPTGTTLDGCVLEAQYRCTQGFLLLTSDNTPYEEGLHIRLLDAHFRVNDAVDLRQVYHSAAVRDLKVIGDDALAFSFFGDDRWHLYIDAKARVHWNLNPFASVYYPTGRLRSHYLRLVRQDSRPS